MGDQRDVKAKPFEILVLVLVIDRFQIRGIFAPTGGPALVVSYWADADAAVAGSVALEGIDATPPKAAVSRDLYLRAAEAFRIQGAAKKAAKMEKPTRRASSAL